MWYNFYHIQLMDKSNWVWHLCTHCELLGLGLVPCHINIDLFEATNTSGIALRNLWSLFGWILIDQQSIDLCEGQR
jgi:hypothetical protein